MRDYLQSLLNGDLDLQSDEVLISEEEVVQGDIGEEVQAVETEVASEEEELTEQLAATEAATEGAIEDSTTLESLVDGLRAAIAKNGALTTEGALFASNHIQSLSTRYGIEFAPNVNNESFTANAAESSRLTLEAAEQTEKSLWERFKSMVKAGWAAVSNFVAMVFRTTENFKRLADSLIARATKVSSASPVEVEIKGGAAMFFHSLNVSGTDGKALVNAGSKGLKTLSGYAGSLGSKVKIVASAEPKAPESDAGVAAAVKSAGAAIAAKLKEIFTVTGDDLLPFNKELVVTEGVAQLNTKKDAAKKDAIKATLGSGDVKALAQQAKAYLEQISKINEGFKAYKAIVEAALKGGDSDGIVGRVKKGWSRALHKTRAWFLARSLSGLAKSSAVVLLNVASSALKKMEGGAKAAA